MPSSSGSQRRGGHIIIGLALLVMGYAVLVIALARQAERNRVGDSAAACVSADVTHGAVPSNATPEPSPASSPPTGLTSSTPADGGATTHGAIRDAGVDGADADTDIAGAHDFWFYAGTLAMAKEDRQRLSALGAALARRPELRVTVQGFGDLAGGDVDAATMARRRARVGQVLLARAGVPEARIVVAVGDPAAEPHLARAVHITTASVPVEVDP